MSAELDPLLKRLHLANARRVWRDLVQRAEKEEWAYDALLLTLFSEEVAHRRQTRLTRAVRAAQFPFLRTIDEFDFTYQSTLRLTTMGSLLTPDFVTEGHSVIFEGKPGRGKTHLAIAIAYRAMQNGFDALFTTAAQLIEELSAASRDGSMRQALARYGAQPAETPFVGDQADDLKAALTYLAKDRAVDAQRMGAIGFCMGGGFAIAWACTDSRLKAIAPFYAANPRPFEVVSRLCPVVGSYPEKDFTASAGRALDKALGQHNVAHDIKIYPGAQHSFFNDTGRSYNRAAAEDSWTRVLKFFGERLGSRSND